MGAKTNVFIFLWITFMIACHSIYFLFIMMYIDGQKLNSKGHFRATIEVIFVKNNDHYD